MSRGKKVVRPIALALAALVVAGGLLLRFYKPSAEGFPIRGVDVSHHQGEIDWPQVAAAGVRFAYIKASEGGDFRDRRFQENWARAKAAGVPRGAYHFFTFCRPGAEQAANFIAAVPADPDALPPAIDFEFVGNCSKRPPAEEVRAELRAFSEAVRARYGKDPLLYVTRTAYARYLWGAADGHRIWLRDVYWKPGSFDGRPWTLWQFDDDARLPGIKGPVDLDAFAGGEAEFAAFRASAAAAPAAK